MEKHGKKSCHGKSWKSHGKWAKKVKSWKFKKVMEKSWNFSTACRESCMRNSDNSIYAYCSVLAMADFQFMSSFPNRNVRQE